MSRFELAAEWLKIGAKHMWKFANNAFIGYEANNIINGDERKEIVKYVPSEYKQVDKDKNENIFIIVGISILCVALAVVAYFLKIVIALKSRSRRIVANNECQLHEINIQPAQRVQEQVPQAQSQRPTL